MTALLLLACNDGPSTLEVTWEVPEREMLLGLDIPRTQDGAYIIGPDQVADPADRTPLSAAAECGAAVLACYEPAQGRDIEACLGAVPTCDTDTPWHGEQPLCCAATCSDAFEEGVQAGLEQEQAMVEALFGEASCAPGLADWRGDS